ncbi:hypothetical protein ABFX02_14G002200 [Erythranthe guttata]
MLLAKFKQGISEDEIEGYIKQYANLVNLVPSMKAFAWYVPYTLIHPLSLFTFLLMLYIFCGVSDDRGKDVSIENLNDGFTHVFESTFASTQGIAEYLSDPDHVAFANTLLPQLDKVLVVDYMPTKVKL